MNAHDLDARILDAIAHGLSDEAFNDLALALFAYQRAHIRAYAAFARDAAPHDWTEIPAVPAAAFKDPEHPIATFPVANAALTFRTSGTTAATSGTHYFETSALYDAALVRGFDDAMLADGARLRYLNLVPRRSTSSLGYMMARVAAVRGDGETGWYLHDEEIDLAGFARDLGIAYAQGVPVCIAGTAFALVAAIDGLAPIPTRPGSRIMETGGFKGRSRVVARDELYRELSRTFGVPVGAIVAEYGMTELTSQWYDDAASRSDDPSAVRIKTGPPWMRALVVDAAGRPVPDGVIGLLRHVDLANRGSVIAIQTEDLGAIAMVEGRRGIVLLGRDADADLRGCSLDAEHLIQR